MFSMNNLVLGRGREEGEAGERERDLPGKGREDQGPEQQLPWVGGLKHAKEGSRSAELT